MCLFELVLASSHSISYSTRFHIITSFSINYSCSNVSRWETPQYYHAFLSSSNCILRRYMLRWYDCIQDWPAYLSNTFLLRHAYFIRYLGDVVITRQQILRPVSTPADAGEIVKSPSLQSKAGIVQVILLRFHTMPILIEWLMRVLHCHLSWTSVLKHKIGRPACVLVVMQYRPILLKGCRGWSIGYHEMAMQTMLLPPYSYHTLQWTNNIHYQTKRNLEMI